VVDRSRRLLVLSPFLPIGSHAKSPFALIKDHVPLPQASLLDQAHAELKAILTDEVLKSIVDLIPDTWLHWEETNQTPEQLREVYLGFLKTRRDHSEIF
jgi:hypothetical protein